jgi:hypothetical protein
MFFARMASNASTTTEENGFPWDSAHSIRGFGMVTVLRINGSADLGRPEPGRFPPCFGFFFLSFLLILEKSHRIKLTRLADLLISY